MHTHTLRVPASLVSSLQLEQLQAAVLDAGVPTTEFLPVVCDVSQVGGAAGHTAWAGAGMCCCFARAEIRPCTAPACTKQPATAAQQPCLCQPNRPSALPRATVQPAEVQALPRIVAKRWPGAHISFVVNRDGGWQLTASLSLSSSCLRPGCWLKSRASSWGSSLPDPSCCSPCRGIAVPAAQRCGRGLPAAPDLLLLHHTSQRVHGTATSIPATCAEAPQLDTSLLSGSFESWAEAVNTSILGTALVIREAVADMERHGSWGQVVHIVDSEEGRGMHAVSRQAACAMAQELRWAHFCSRLGVHGVPRLSAAV